MIGKIVANSDANTNPDAERLVNQFNSIGTNATTMAINTISPINKSITLSELIAID